MSSLSARRSPLRRQNEPLERTAFQSRCKLIGVDRIRQQPSGNLEYGEHWLSSMMPPACASAWRRSAPRGSVHCRHGKSSILRTVSAEVLIVSPHERLS
jgi:hypothetical protein